MKSLIPVTLVILARWVSIDPAAGVSVNILNFMSMENGHFYYNSGNTTGSNTLLTFTAIPVSVPALAGKNVLYGEESINGNIYRMVLLVVTEGSDGIIYMTPYNFTDYTKYKPGTFDLNYLTTLRPKDLQTVEGCTVVCENLSPGVYVQKWPDSRHTVNGKHLMYELTLTCDSASVDPPQYAKEKSGAVPYKLLRYGNKYPLIGAPDNFVSVCDRKT